LERTHRPDARFRLHSVLLTAAFALLPWTWFLVRDRAPIMDLIAVVLPPICLVAVVVLAIFALIRRSWWVGVVGLSVAAFTLAVIQGPRVAQAGPAPRSPFRLVSANVYRENDRQGEAATTLLASHADVLVVIEAEPGIAEPLDAVYRHHVGEDVAIYTDYPIRELPNGASIRKQRVVRARLWGPGGPFILYVVHQMNPLYDAGFAQQTVDLEALLARASKEKQPVVLSGDFNMTDRSSGYREVTTQFRDAMRSGSSAGSTYENGLWSPLFLRIDHIFEGPAWCASNGSRLAVPGSDHRAIGASLGPCPGTPIEPSRRPRPGSTPAPGISASDGGTQTPSSTGAGPTASNSQGSEP
jgi:endonuclease/exonuclease/phosphatase (EEP) superfamily protein YafD